ncbi:phosphopantetheine-binding protein [Algibacter lectus]|uniref:Peptide synthetase n=1 Tax=Algibacter lectus TaxID=221126 RepID=A0A090VHL9_9FLAO|nr:phosphopantetheine-binding protein [Algibacter lectus]GAL64251.1 peptide synthetase [Algibacter lectus]
MIPSIFIWLNEFPITTNGKIDKEKLPQPEYVRPDSAPLFRKPRTKLEKDIASIWSEQLQVPSIGIDDNFFEMGGTSLLTQKVATLMRKRFKLKIPVTKIYQHPTIKEIATYIENDGKTAPSIDYSKVKKNKASTMSLLLVWQEDSPELNQLMSYGMFLKMEKKLHHFLLMRNLIILFQNL